MLSMLYDKDLTVPDAASAVQLEQRVRAKVPNPFNAAALRAKSKDKKIVDKPEQLRGPQMQVAKRIASSPVSPRIHTTQLDLMHRRLTCTIQLVCRLRPHLQLHPSWLLARMSKSAVSILLRPKNRCPRNACHVARYGLARSVFLRIKA